MTKDEAAVLLSRLDLAKTGLAVHGLSHEAVAEAARIVRRVVSPDEETRHAVALAIAKAGLDGPHAQALAAIATLAEEPQP